VEGGGHPNEVHESGDVPHRTVQSELDQLREDKWSRGLRNPRQRDRPTVQVQFSEVRILLEDLREMNQSMAALLPIGKEEFQ